MKARELRYLLEKYDVKDDDEVVFECTTDTQKGVCGDHEDSKVSIRFVEACRIQCDHEGCLKFMLDVIIDHNGGGD